MQGRGCVQKLPRWSVVALATSLALSGLSACEDEANDGRKSSAPAFSANPARKATEPEVLLWLQQGRGAFFERGVDVGPRKFSADGTYTSGGIAQSAGYYSVQGDTFCMHRERASPALGCWALSVTPEGPVVSEPFEDERR